MALHTTQLGFASGLGTGTSVIYTCPTGVKAIVKELLIRNNGGAGAYMLVEILFNAGGSLVRRVQLGAVGAAGEYVREAGWTVLEPGDKLRVSMSVGTGAVIASGTELAI